MILPDQQLDPATVEMASCRYGTISYFKSDPIVGRALREWGEWAQNELDFLLGLLTPGDTAVDVGAFVGTHTLAFAQHLGLRGNVLAFEPHPLSFQLLKLNVAQNALSTVELFNVALSDRSERLIALRTVIGDAKSLGSFSVLSKGDPAGREDTFEIPTMTLDEYGLDTCHLLKIDVEGMEPRVIKGCEKTLQRLRPLVYAECLSLESGWQTVLLMRSAGFEALLHNEASYNPRNFRRNPNNFLGPARETNILFVPQDTLQDVRRRCRQFESLIPIRTVDDLALGLLKKPQYKYEGLAPTQAAQVLGIGFVANEPELRDLESRLEEKTLRMKGLESHVHSLESHVHSLESQVHSLESQILQVERSIPIQLVRRYQRVVDRLLRPGTRRRRPYDLALMGMRVILNEGWRQTFREARRWLRTRGLRQMEHQQQDYCQQPQGEASALTGIRRPAAHHDADLVFEVDYLRIRCRRIYGWGWVLHRSKSVASVALTLMIHGEEMRIPSEYGMSRPDVANLHTHPGALTSGFMVGGKVPEGTRPEVYLDILLDDGSSARFDVTGSVGEDSGRPRTAERTITRWTRTTVRYLLAGDIGGWLRQARILIAQRTRTERQPRAFSADIASKIGRASERAGLFLIVDHNLGGGANTYRERLIRQKQTENIPVLLLYYHLPELEYHGRFIWQKENHTFVIESLESFISFVSSLRIQDIFLNNVFSFDDPLFVLTLLLQIKHSTGATLTVPIHDFCSVCPSYTLLDETGQFCGIPGVERCQRCLPANRGSFQLLIDFDDIVMWRSVWHSVLQCASTILCFSKSSAELLCRAYPDLDRQKMVIRPHQVDPPATREVQLDFSRPLNIGIVGTISEQKGARIVQQMANIIVDRHLPAHITVIGEMDRPLRSPAVTVTGRYRVEDLPRMIKENRVNVFFLPSVWPETFCYVAEELMLLNLPLAVFELGAPAERVAEYPGGLIISRIDANTALNELTEFHAKLRERPSATRRRTTESEVP